MCIYIYRYMYTLTVATRDRQDMSHRSGGHVTTLCCFALLRYAAMR